jgi:hypothetical protein
MKMELEETLFETCTEHWSINDFKNIDLVCDWTYLKKHGWTLDYCGNASNGEYHVSNNGELWIEGQLPELLTEWINNDEFIKENSKLYDLLTQNLQI